MEKVHASQKEEVSANNELKNELAALKTHHEASQAELKAKVDEANTAVTKLKESIQGILKKVKEEFTALTNDPNEAALKKAAKKEFSERQLAEIVALKS